MLTHEQLLQQDAQTLRELGIEKVEEPSRDQDAAYSFVAWSVRTATALLCDPNIEGQLLLRAALDRQLRHMQVPLEHYLAHRNGAALDVLSVSGKFHEALRIAKGDQKTSHWGRTDIHTVI